MAGFLNRPCLVVVVAGFIISMLAQALQAPAVPASQAQIPLVTGLVMVSVTQGPDGDLENLVTVQDASARGVRFAWRLDETTPAGERRRLLFGREVRAVDLAGAQSLHTVFALGDSGPQPGTTSLLLSRQTFARLTKKGFAPLTITMVDPGSDRPVTMPGTAGVITRDLVPFPLLVNGQRVSLPSLRVHVVLHDQGTLLHSDFHVLAQPGHPLILRNDRPGGYRTQVARIDFPDGTAATVARAGRALESACRAELPGVYFASGSSELDEHSYRAIAALADLVRQHADWDLEIEGHTDDIGSAAANLALSSGRAAAVRDRLVGAHGIPAARIRTAGLGESRPREANDSLEGRARNRRVEITRRCGR